MALDFKFPDVGEGIHEGVLLAWLVKEGDAVAVDQPFVKVETDKAVVDLPAPKKGVVLALRVQKGATIHVGDVIATFGDAGEKLLAGAEAAAGTPALEPATVANPERMLQSLPPAVPAPLPHGEKPVATPHTRAYARKLGVDLAACAPTGKGGRITEQDVDRAAAGPPTGLPVSGSPAARAVAPPLAEAPAPSGIMETTQAGLVERVAVTHLRKVISQAMSLSAGTSVHVTHVDEADVTDLVAAHRRMKDHIEKGGGAKFSLMPIFIKAAVAVLKDHPLFNATYDEAAGQLVMKKYFHIGVAVDTPEGLIVPVVKDADRKDMVAIAAELADLSARARERRLNLDEIRGASFTLTNIGAIGGLMATPIIHQPELAICGLFAIKDKPAVVAGAVVPRKLMNLSITFDHRVIDGAQGARFMRDLVQLLEHPELLMARM